MCFPGVIWDATFDQAITFFQFWPIFSSFSAVFCACAKLHAHLGRQICFLLYLKYISTITCKKIFNFLMGIKENFSSSWFSKNENRWSTRTNGKKPVICIFARVALGCFFHHSAHGIFYVFSQCRHDEGEKNTTKIHLRPKKRQKPPKKALFRCFSLFSEVSRILLKNGSNDFD